MKGNRSDCALNLITFDDNNGALQKGGVVPAGYKNFTWSNANYISVETTPVPSAFRKAVVSPLFVIHNPTGRKITLTKSNGLPFSLEYLHFTTVLSVPHNMTFIVNTTGAKHSNRFMTTTPSSWKFVCDDLCTGIHAMVAEMEYNKTDAPLASTDTQFIIDNLCIS